MINFNTNVDVPSSHGMATKHTLYTPEVISGSIDEELFEKAKAESEAINASFASQQDSFDELKNMTSIEARIHLERKYKPLLNAAVGMHKLCCDDVSHFEDFSDSFKATERGRYAQGLMHPDIKKIPCNGDVHFQHLIQSGALSQPGMKLVDRRVVNLSLNGVHSQSSTIVLIPDDVPSIISFADTKEAHEYADATYDRELRLLIQKRKKAALELQQLRDEVSSKWDSVDNSFEEMLSSTIRKGRK